MCSNFSKAELYSDRSCLDEWLEATYYIYPWDQVLGTSWIQKSDIMPRVLKNNSEIEPQSIHIHIVLGKMNDMDMISQSIWSKHNRKEIKQPGFSFNAYRTIGMIGWMLLILKLRQKLDGFLLLVNSKLRLLEKNSIGNFSASDATYASSSLN